MAGKRKRLLPKLRAYLHTIRLERSLKRAGLSPRRAALRANREGRKTLERELRTKLRGARGLARWRYYKKQSRTDLGN